MRSKGGDSMRWMKINTDKGKTFKEVFDEFLLNCKARGLREGTISHYEQRYLQIKKYIDEDMKIVDINKSVFESTVIKIRENKEIAFLYPFLGEG